MRRWGLLGSVVLAAVGAAATSGPPHDTPSLLPLAAAMLQPRDAPELKALPKLAERLARGPHDYLRGTNALFLRALCERYEEAVKSLPAVTLHGDAHVEQYSVTDRGRGLTDFDDSAVGSAFIDLARFATSIRIAMEQRGWPDADGMIRSFLDGYTRALRAPKTVAVEPAAVVRIRKSFDPNRMALLANAEKLMVPLPAEQQPHADQLQHVALVLGEASNRSPAFFQVKKLGGLTIGIGSAADEKYLMRIEGPTPAPDDDLMLELKEVKPLPDLPCIYGVRDAARVLLGEKLIAYEQFAVSGSLQAGGRFFWFHTWTDHYAELKIDTSFEDPSELREVVYDAGVQLGRGHPRRVAGDEAANLRRTLLKNVDKAPIYPVSADFAAAIRDAWQAFKPKS
jgi:hypothetical protein